MGQDATESEDQRAGAHSLQQSAAQQEAASSSEQQDETGGTRYKQGLSMTRAGPWKMRISSSMKSQVVWWRRSRAAEARSKSNGLAVMT
jgi:hypothetical protein